MCVCVGGGGGVDKIHTCVTGVLVIAVCGACGIPPTHAHTLTGGSVETQCRSERGAPSTLCS